MPSSADRLFGKLVLLNRYATREQVDACIAEQQSLEREGKIVPLSELMQQKNFLTADQVASIRMEQSYLEVRKEDLRIGELAIKDGLATEAQVSECLTLQEKRFREKRELFRIGEIMQERGYVTEQQVTALRKARERLKAAAAAQRQREKKAKKKEEALPTAPTVDAPSAVPPQRPSDSALRPLSTGAPPVIPPQKRPSDPALYPVSGSVPPAAPPHKTPSDPLVRAIPTAPPLAPIAHSGQPIDASMPTVPPTKTPSESPLVPHGEPSQTRSREPWLDISSGSGPTLNAEGVRASVHVVQLEGMGLAKHKQVVVVSVEGVLDAHTFPFFEQFMKELADAGHRYFVVNCAKLDYISSPGIGVLIGMAKRARDMKGDLRVAELPAKIKHIFDLISGGGVIRIFELERGAIMSFKYV